MRTRNRILVALLCAGLGLGLYAQPAIPKTRFRVLYKATGEPVNWIAVQVYCQRKLGWGERQRTAEDYETVYHSFSYHPTKDGWVTLPAIEAPGTTEYSIEIYAPGCGYFLYPYKFSERSGSRPFNEETLPKFLRMPEEKRVLYAQYANDQHWFVPIRETTFEGIQYSLDAVKIFFMEWPILMCDGYGYTPPHGAWDRAEHQGRAPYYKENYFQRMLSYLHNMQEVISQYEASAASQPDESIKRDIRAKAQELRARLMTIVCGDLQEKKQLWDSHKLPPVLLNDPGLRTWLADHLEEWDKRKEEEAQQHQRGFEPSAKLLDDPFMQQADCDALREFYARRQATQTVSPAPGLAAPGAPSPSSPPQPPPAQVPPKH